MSRPSMLILFGIVVVLIPFSGLPIAFRTLLSVIFGAAVAGIGLSLRTDMARPAPSVTPASEPTLPEPAPQGISSI